MSQSPDYLQPGSVCEAGSRSLKLAKVEDEKRVRRCGNGGAETDVGILGSEKPSVATAAR